MAITFGGLDVRPDRLLWSPDHPNLIWVDITVEDPQEGWDDHVTTYFGMRSIAVRDGRILLNGELLFQRLVLDQGYWEESPADAAVRGSAGKRPGADPGHGL